MDFSNYIFRCSSLGKIMTGVKPPLTDNQEAELIRLRVKRDAGKITDLQTITLGELLDKKLAKPELSTTTKTYLQKLHKESLFKRNKNLTNKYCDKGIQGEERNMTLYSNVNDTLFLKNKQRFSNEYITGEPDNLQKKVRDLKTSWDYETFPFYDTAIPSSDYEWQLQGYMELTGIESAELIYGLIDTPHKIINDELRRLDWRENIMDNDGEIRKTSIDLVVETVSNMVYTEKGLEEFCDQSTNVHKKWFVGKFTEVPESLRLKVFEVRKDPEKITALYAQIGKCRDYMNELSLTIADHLQVA